MDVAGWLRRLGLEEYEPAFRTNAIDATVLPTLTGEDLREIGIAAVGHRRRLLDAIAALRDGVAAAPPAAAGPGGAERRHLTVLFCDMVGSTALASSRDPEDMREIIATYQRCVADVVGHFDGFVAKYMGDGVLAYFGYPRAHEDDAERAVRAGLAIVNAVGRLDTAEPLRARLGIASGLVVVGDLIGEGEAQERGVVGETPNLAARLQGLAGPNGIVIAESTCHQLGTLFDVEDLGPQRLSGFAEAQGAWRVLSESGVISRFEALRSGATPLVGREEELYLLRRRWQQAQLGEGRVVLVTGEPGIGKSRLTAAIGDATEGDAPLRLSWFCSPHHQDSALYPVIVQLERAAGFARNDNVNERLGKLDAVLAPGAPDDPDRALLRELMSLPNAAGGLNLSPQRKREKLFEALLSQLAALARDRAVLAAFEDAHWADPTSRELLDLMVDRVRRLPMLLLITFRPEFQATWGDQPHVTTLALSRLGERDITALVRGLARNIPLGGEVVEEIIERTDGVPLFVEELTKAVLESTDQRNRVAAVLSARPAAALAVPATLQASLMARLDRLGAAAKEVAQIGAVLGREFSYELIEYVAQRPEVDAALERLTAAGLVSRRGSPPWSSYVFKHALVQDVAYGTLLRSRRQELHARVAAVLQQRFGEVVERQPELLAHHLSGTTELLRAAAQWLKAGQRAIERSANREGVSHLHKGLAVLQTLPQTADRDRYELELQTTLGGVLVAVKAPGAPDVGEAYARARELCQRLGEVPEQGFPVAWGLWYFHLGRGELATAHEIGTHLLRLAETSGDPALLLVAHRSLGQNLSFLGELSSARHHLEQGIGLYDVRKHRELAFRYGQDLGVLCSSWACVVLWLLGYPDRALDHSRAALALAGEINHPYSQCYALNWTIILHLCRRETRVIDDHSRNMLTLAREQRFAPWVASAAMWQGWVQTAADETAAGLVEMRESISAWLASGVALFRPYYLILLAEAIAAGGNTAEALAVLADALSTVEETGERFYEAELHRLEGELLRRQQGRDVSEAETCFRRALDVSRRQQARSLELRAATSLARLWGEQGRRAEARELLVPIHGWFTEGLDTADLKDATAMLDTLG